MNTHQDKVGTRTHRAWGRRPVVVLAVAALGIGGLGVPGAVAASDPVPSSSMATDAYAARAGAQAPLVQVANMLRAEVERHDSKNFAGIALGDKAVDFYWRGTLPQWAKPVLARAALSAPVAVHGTTYSLAERKAAADAVIRRAAKDKTSGISGVRVPVGTNDIFVETQADLALSTARARRSTAVPVRAVKAGRQHRAARHNDARPLSGGGKMVSPWRWCTLGWPITWSAYQNQHGPSAVLTAGRCGWPDYTWRTGAGDVIGSGGLENVAHDILAVDSLQVSNRMYDGLDVDFPTGQFFKTIVGWDRIYPGEMLCTSGAETGALCDLRNSADFSYSYTDEWDFLYTDMILATRLNGGLGAQEGDSGGPVFALAGDSPRIVDAFQGHVQQGQVQACGVISTFREHSDVAYQDFHTVFRDYAAVPMTNVSLRSALGGRCVDADLGTILVNGNRAQLWDCNAEQQQQMVWNHFDDRSVRNRRNGKCLDADLNRINSNGAVVQF